MRYEIKDIDIKEFEEERFFSGLWLLEKNRLERKDIGFWRIGGRKKSEENSLKSEGDMYVIEIILLVLSLYMGVFFRWERVLEKVLNVSVLVYYFCNNTVIYNF